MTDSAIPSPPAHSELAPLLDRVLAFTSIRSYGAGEPVLTPGTTTNAFYYLVSGSVEVGYTDPHDTRITVALIGAGEFFGEIGYFDGQSRVRDIRTAATAGIAVFD